MCDYVCLFPFIKHSKLDNHTSLLTGCLYRTYRFWGHIKGLKPVFGWSAFFDLHFFSCSVSGLQLVRGPCLGKGGQARSSDGGKNLGRVFPYVIPLVHVQPVTTSGFGWAPVSCKEIAGGFCMMMTGTGESSQARR